MKRFLSGIQATGDLHIGNYLGAIKPCVELQGEGESIYFVPNLHSLNTRPDPAKLRKETLSNIAWFMAAGIDPNKSILYVQSGVSANAELCWILNNFVTMGELSRQTQYKDKSSKKGVEGQLVGLFAYPVLMAADILLYSATHVPVGEDQAQHVELARDIAERFNNIYGDTFVVPEAVVRKVGARVMNLQNPDKKMSKSDEGQSGNILLLDDKESIQNKIKRAVTDSEGLVEFSDTKPAIANLLQIYSGVTGDGIEAITAKYAGKGYGELKTDLANVVVDSIVELQTKYHELLKNEDYLLEIVKEGNRKANEIASAKLLEVKVKLGLL